MSRTAGKRRVSLVASKTSWILSRRRQSEAQGTMWRSTRSDFLQSKGEPGGEQNLLDVGVVRWARWRPDISLPATLAEEAEADSRRAVAAKSMRMQYLCSSARTAVPP
jgi:hypothetical protein